MKTINLLLGNSDRRINNLIEVAVRDVCYDLAVVECYRTARLDEFTQRGCCEGFDLIVIAPGHLAPGLVKRTPRDPIEEAVRAIRAIKEHRTVPILGVAVPAEHELRMLMAGTDNVFGAFFNVEVMKSEVRRVLNLAEKVEEAAPVRSSRPSFTESLMRGFDRFKQAVGS
jgi:hypothetical protein